MMRTLPAISRSVAAACLGCLLTAPVALADAGENTALNLPDTNQAGKVSHVSSGGSILRTIAGLAIVLGVIYGITWVLKKIKASKETAVSGNSLEQVATLPLGGNRSLHLVRAGDELVLIGAAEHGVTPIRRGGGDRARPDRRPAGRHADHARRRRRAGPPDGVPRGPALQDGDQVKTDGSNAVQMLLLVGGISLVPALLFTVTGFTRILIVLGFIRSGLGTPTAPPNQVLVGIA